MDRAARLLSAAVRLMPAERRDWGRAMRAELAAIDDPADRWSFARSCLRAFRPLRGAMHLLAVLFTLGSLLTWISTTDYPPLALILYVVVTVLAAVCWQGRRAGMLGPTDDGATAWVLRAGGYLIAATVTAVALHRAGDDVLALVTIASSFLIGLAVATAKQSAATRRVLLTGAGSAVAATVVWLVPVLVDPPIPDTAGWALAVTAGAGVVAVLANADSTRRSLLAGLLATAGALALVFVTVSLLAHLGPDSLIPDVTPGALPGQHITESRSEIIDPYVLILVLSAVAATALGLAAVATRRPVAEPARAGR